MRNNLISADIDTFFSSFAFFLSDVAVASLLWDRSGYLCLLLCPYRHDRFLKKEMVASRQPIFVINLKSKYHEKLIQI